MLKNLAGWSLEFFPGLALYSLACLGAGIAAISIGSRSNQLDDRPAYFVMGISFLFGLGALGQLWTLLALAGVMRPAYVGPVVVALAIVAVMWIARNFALLRHRAMLVASALRKESVGVQLLALAVVLWIAFGFTSFGRTMSGDGLALHMMVGKFTSASGALHRYWFVTGNEFYGVLGEMTHAALMELANPDAAQVFSWAANLAGALALLGICERAGIGLRGKIFALAMMFSSTAVLAWIGEGKIDLFASSLGLAGLALLVPSRTGAPIARRDLVLSGLLIGFAITCKLILGFCLAILCAVLFGWTVFGQAAAGLRARAPFFRAFIAPAVLSGCIFGFSVLLGLAPHFVKNGLLLGLPFAPLNFGGQHTRWFIDEQWYGPQTVARIRLLYPFVLTFGDYFPQFGQLSPLVLGLLPLALFLKRPKHLISSPLTAVSVAAFGMLAIWAVLYADKTATRYFIPALLLCIPLPARAAEYVTNRSFVPRYLGAAVIVFAFRSALDDRALFDGILFRCAESGAGHARHRPAV